MADDPARQPPPTVTLSSRRGFDGKLLHVRVDDVRLPSGRESVREVVERPGAVAVVALTRDLQVVLICQFHHAVGRGLLGIPAGTREPGEDPAETARRELLEETGYAAGSMRHLAGYFTSPGFTDERMEIYRADDCVQTRDIADPDESIAIELVALAEIPDLLAPGPRQLEEGKGLIGLALLLRELAAGR